MAERNVRFNFTLTLLELRLLELVQEAHKLADILSQNSITMIKLFPLPVLMSRKGKYIFIDNMAVLILLRRKYR